MPRNLFWTSSFTMMRPKSDSTISGKISARRNTTRIRLCSWTRLNSPGKGRACISCHKRYRWYTALQGYKRNPQGTVVYSCVLLQLPKAPCYGGEAMCTFPPRCHLLTAQPWRSVCHHAGHKTKAHVRSGNQTYR